MNHFVYDIHFRRSLAQTEDLCVTLKICMRCSFRVQVGSYIRFDQKLVQTQSLCVTFYGIRFGRQLTLAEHLYMIRRI